MILLFTPGRETSQVVLLSRTIFLQSKGDLSNLVSLTETINLMQYSLAFYVESMEDTMDNGCVRNAFELRNYSA